jgi:hypothetical protein
MASFAEGLAMRATRSAGGLGTWAVGALLAWGAVATATAAEPAATSEDKDVIAAGREIFLREWLPKDPRSHGGGTAAIALSPDGATGATVGADGEWKLQDLPRD